MADSNLVILSNSGMFKKTVVLITTHPVTGENLVSVYRPTWVTDDKLNSVLIQVDKK